MSARDLSALVALESVLEAASAEGQPFSPAVSAELDRLEAFPAAACKVLDDFGLAAWYVPRRHGGRMESFSELLQLWRAVARRDLTVAVAHGKTFLGTGCVWVAADPEQARLLGRDVAAGAVVSWGLTERGHGSDLLAGELTARPDAAGWRVDGEKWLINNATRGLVLCALARTDAAGGSRGFSLFLIDKRSLSADTYRCLPKEATHGIRGADISGIAYANAPLPPGALVGSAGQGVEIVLKALQMSRTACSALSLGAADHALALALRFAAERQLYGRRMIDLPLVRRAIGEAAATLLAAEAVSVVAGRCMAALPGEMSVVAALAKAHVPSAVDEMIGSLGELLGARAFLTEVFEHGMFQKLERDHRIVAIFDGSTVVNRNGLINQFRNLARGWRDARCDRDGLAIVFDAGAALPEFAPEKLSLMSAGGCSVLQSLPHTCTQLTDAPARVQRLATAMCAASAATLEQCGAYQPSPREVPPAAFDLARRYELCFAGAACVGYWLANHAANQGAPLWQDALWLEAALVRLLAQLTPDAPGLEDDMVIYDTLAQALAAPGAPRASILAPAGEAA
ncbi:acyl-CoA dehydrogenase family protein [Massilia pseudoviolaceinigra]|uniref:acyl-CoA dehydrogenase family protein n=1 Tax=Massilia pseudoviolaceinigra TaxID=3057165 RepID=UPI0027965B4A|nr:acyl-CoA dehydrogenase family protein [Massilia sp. CCM 9206]MDQ1919270.1 acyl-CoA dehydrogenase family protein [Massilia sp. CCM 9206]